MINFSRNTALLKSTVSVIVFLFGAFNGFLLKFAPPDPADELDLPVGIAKFSALAILLFVSLLCNFQAVKKKADQKNFVLLWLWVSGILIVGFIICSLTYFNNFKQHTVYQYNWQTRLVKGDSLTADSKAICQEDSHNRSSQDCEQYLLYKYYNANQVNIDHLLWTEESVQANTMKLLIYYIVLVLCISGLLFSMVELLSWNIFNKQQIGKPS